MIHAALLSSTLFVHIKHISVNLLINFIFNLQLIKNTKIKKTQL